MAFSGALTLTDLNDYLGPSQACIKPVSGKDAPGESAPVETPGGGGGGAGIEIAIDRDGAYYESAALASGSGSTGQASEPRARTKLETAEISLNDCLACSGCVTSAESVLIGMQSTEELKRAVEEKRGLAEANPDTRHLLVASISPQTLASLSAKHSLHLPPGSFVPSSFLLQRIDSFLRSVYNFDHVLDTTFARHISLLEHVAEFKERRAAERQGKGGQLPMLASACPGWICYAEKTHGELLPFIGKTKSPQQIAGVIAKDWLPRSSSTVTSSAASIFKSTSTYHLAVMPCYDKKLEASRQDFYDELRRDKDVDCVLTTGELEALMLEHGWGLLDGWEGQVERGQRELPGAVEEDEVKPPSPPASEVDVKVSTTPAMSDPGIPNAVSHPGSSSGSYLFSLMAAVWAEHVSELSAAGQPQPQLEIRTIRNADYTEFVLRSLPGGGSGVAEGQEEEAGARKTLFKAAQCYGFRNLQNLVRKVQKQGGVRGKRGAAGLLVDEEGQAVTDGLGAPPRRGMVRGRGRGMIRRGRGGAATPGGSGTSTPNSNAVVDEERGYDYVEVMACPGGCVNGGGQLRPPVDGGVEGAIGAQGNGGASSLVNRGTQEQTEAMLDVPLVKDSAVIATQPSSSNVLDSDAPEGWNTPQHSSSSAPSVDGLSVAGNEVGGGGDEEEPVKGWQGTSKEWVKRVEKAYWASSYSPSPSRRGEEGDEADAVRIPIGSVHAAQSMGLASSSPAITVQISDALLSSFSRDAVLGPQATKGSTKGELDDLADRMVEEISRETGKGRDTLLRTKYHAVGENEVSGLAVQW